MGPHVGVVGSADTGVRVDGRVVVAEETVDIDRRRRVAVRRVNTGRARLQAEVARRGVDEQGIGIHVARARVSAGYAGVGDVARDARLCLHLR